MSKLKVSSASPKQMTFEFLLASASTAGSDYEEEQRSGLTSEKINALNQRFSQLHSSAVEAIRSRDHGVKIQIPQHVTDYGVGEPRGFYYPEKYREKFLAADALQVNVNDAGGVFDAQGYAPGSSESNILIENNPFPSKDSKEQYDSMYVDWGLNLKENKYFDLVNPKVENKNSPSGFSYLLTSQEYKMYVDAKFSHAEKLYAKSLAQNIGAGKSASALPPMPEGVSVVAMAMSVKTMLASIVQVAINDYIRATEIAEGPVPTTPKKLEQYNAAKKEASEIVAYFKDQVPGLEIPFSRVFHNLDIAEQVSLPDFVDLCVHEPHNVKRGLTAYLEALGGAKANGKAELTAVGSAPDDLCSAAEREVELAMINPSVEDYDDAAPTTRLAQ